MAGTQLVADYQPTTLHEATALSRAKTEYQTVAGFGTCLVSAVDDSLLESGAGHNVGILITRSVSPDFTYDWLASAEPMLSHVWGPVPLPSGSFPSIFDRVRESTSLPMAGLAVLIGAPRRTLYHWRSTGHAPEPALGRLHRVSRWINEVQERGPGIPLREEFDPAKDNTIGALLIEGRDDEALERRLDLLLEPKRPKRARRVTGERELETEDLALSSDEWTAALRAFSTPRDNQARQAPWRPVEVTDTEPDDAA